jgi:hypothetical protein
MTGIACILGLGGAGKPVQLPGGYVFNAVTGSPGDTATAGFYFRIDGTLDMREDAAYTADTPWYVYAPATGIGSGFWIKAVKLSGSTPDTGILNAWQQLSSDRSWTKSISVQGNLATELQISIASSPSDADIIDQGIYQIEVELAF